VCELSGAAGAGSDAVESRRAFMENKPPETVLYKRSNFVTRLPLAALYSPSHCWLADHGGSWRVGFTKFATRMLGDMVDHGFNVEPGAPVETGRIVGWIEGFKAISDVYCVVDGEFQGGNPALSASLGAIDRDCYRAGWLYQAVGHPGALCMDAAAYQALLDKTIDKILEKQQAAETNE
jgi:glycine cleavage system H protein